MSPTRSAAQIALKRAKQTDRIEIYEPEAALLADNRSGSKPNCATRSRKTGCIDFQPLVELSTGKGRGLQGAGALEQRRPRGVAFEFIPVAEDPGLIVPLGQWAIAKAAETLAAWDRENDSRSTAISRSMSRRSSSFRDDVAAVVREALERHGIGGDRLMIELTESVIGDPLRCRC